MFYLAYDDKCYKNSCSPLIRLFDGNGNEIVINSGSFEFDHDKETQDYSDGYRLKYNTKRKEVRVDMVLDADYFRYCNMETIEKLKTKNYTPYFRMA